MPATNRDGVTIEYGTRGTGPVVVLVPDACVGPWMYAWVVAELAELVRVVTVAPRGCAGSDPAPSTDEDGYAVAEHSADVEAVLSELGARRVHVVGSGFGGQVGLEYAATYGRARSATLLGTATTPRFDPDIRTTLCTSNPIASLRPYLGPLLESLPSEQLRTWRDGEDPTPEVRGYQLDAATAFEGPPLHELTVPTNCFVGENDAVWSVEAATELGANLPNGRVETVIDAPHLLPVAAPTLVADEVVGLIEDTTEEPW